METYELGPSGIGTELSQAIGGLRKVGQLSS